MGLSPTLDGTVRESPDRRRRLHLQRAIEVVAGLGVIRSQAEGFLELEDRLVDSVLVGEGDAEVAAGLGVIRFEAEGFLELADGRVDLASLGERDSRGCCGRSASSGCRRRASWNWRMASSIWPFCSSAVPRL